MSLEALLDIENPTEEDVIREADESFYRKALSLRGNNKKKIKELVTDRAIRETSAALFAALRGLGFTSLDDFKSRKGLSGLSTLLGEKAGNTSELKKKLASLGVYSIELSKYDNVEEFCSELLGDIKEGSPISAYFLPQHASAEVIERNRKLLTQSEAFKTYLKNKGVECLDDVTKERAISGLGSLFGFNKWGNLEFRMFLISNGVYPVRLSEYEDVDLICGRLVADLSNKKTKVYFSTDYVGVNDVEDNRIAFARSKAFRDYLVSRGIESLDDVTMGHATSSLSTLFGLNNRRSSGMKKALIKYGAFSSLLSDYDNIEDVCKGIVCGFRRAGWSSAFLSTDFLKPEEVEENRRTFATSETFREYLDNEGVYSLDHLTQHNTTHGLTSVLGSRIYNASLTKSRLIELGTFSTSLRDYDDAERICTHIIDNINFSMGNSVYFSPEYVSEESIRDNRVVFVQSKAFQDYLKRERIRLDDLTTVSSKKAQHLFAKVLGVDVSSSRSIEQLLPESNYEYSESYRKIVTEWDENDVQYLRDLVPRALHDDVSVSDYMRENRKQIEEDLGRTLFACMMKMASIGLIPRFINFGPDEGGRAEIHYPFPEIHGEQEPDVLIQFSNYSAVLDAGLEPKVLPVYAYHSVAEYDCQSQFVHATIPIKFKGSSLEAYTLFEQHVLAEVQRYLADPNSYSNVENTLVLNSSTRLSPEDINVLAVKENGNLYAQVLVRTRFSRNPEKVSTNAIKVGDSEIYLFKHSQEGVTFENTRR